MSFRKKKNKPAPLEWVSPDNDDQQVSTSPRRSPLPLSPLKSPIAKSPTNTNTAKSPTSRRNSGNLAYLASRRTSNSTTTTLSTNTSPLHSPTNPPYNFEGGRRRRRQSNFLELPVLDWPQRKQRVSSLPINNPRNYFQRQTSSDDDEDEDDNVLMYRLRSFNITNNRVINCGDSILPRFDGGKLINKHRSNNSSRNSPMHSNNSPSESLYDYCDDEEEEEINRFRVVLLGHSSVGKSALVTQFMTSDYINTYDASLDDEFGCHSVSVLLDGSESEMIMIDHPPENCLTTYNPSGILVLYSVVDRHSFEIASDILRYLWQESITQEKAVILVGNKCDLERAREVPMQEGKTMATSFEAKFIECSSGIQHNVDELLVGTLKQCRLRRQKNTKKLPRNLSFFSIHELAKELISKLCKHEIKKKQSKSCQNLHVL